MTETYHPDESGRGFRLVSRTLRPEYDDDLIPEELTEAELEEAASFYEAEAKRDRQPSIEWDANAGFSKHTHTHGCGHICRAAFCVYNGFATVLCVACQVAKWESRAG